MQLLWNAVRAVTVEALGVLVVVWLLFHTAGWTAAAWNWQPGPQFDSSWGWLDQSASDNFTPAASPTRVCWSGEAGSVIAAFSDRLP